MKKTDAPYTGYFLSLEPYKSGIQIASSRTIKEPDVRSLPHLVPQPPPSRSTVVNNDASSRTIKNVTPNVVPIDDPAPGTVELRNRDNVPAIVPASTPATFQLPAITLRVVDRVMQELAAATSDQVRASKSELLVILAKDFCDVVTFMGEGSAQYQHHMSRAAENRRIVAGHEHERLVTEQATDILEATHGDRKRAEVANSDASAIAAEASRDVARARAADHRLSTDPAAVRCRMIARHTVLDAVIGNVKVSDTNHYRAFARLLYDLYMQRLEHEAALEKATAILAARMEEEDFDRATGSEFYDLFIERRGAIARETQANNALAAQEREHRHTETLQRLKADEESHKAQRMQTLKDITGDGKDYDPSV